MEIQTRAFDRSYEGCKYFTVEMSELLECTPSRVFLMCCLRLQAGIRLALILVIRLRHSAAGFIQGEQIENKSRSVPMPTRRSEHNAWMVDDLWNVDVRQFHDNDIGKGSDSTDGNG